MVKPGSSVASPEVDHLGIRRQGRRSADGLDLVALNDDDCAVAAAAGSASTLRAPRVASTPSQKQAVASRFIFSPVLRRGDGRAKGCHGPVEFHQALT